jgi:hypothetical protein
MERNTGEVFNGMDFSRSKVIACATVIEEMLPFIPPQMRYEKLDFGLHLNPNELKNALGKVIDSTASDIDTLVLGYGLCSQAVVGLKSDRCTLIIPKVDDCIAIFLGSVSIYKNQHKSQPGTYYLTKGWIKAGDTPFDEFDSIIEQYGLERARFIMNQMLKNYTRLAFINTDNSGLEEYHAYAKNIAQRFGLSYEEIEGSDVLIKKMVCGLWDDDFLVVKPGKTITFSDFKK